MAVDRAADRAYVMVMSGIVPNAASRRLSLPLVAVGLGMGALLALAGALWLHYGTAVFFEIVRAGIAACF
ncbi:hypothetical protein [Pseudorhodoplanes sp.]|uniref:hypothetical protein n=1 Tax=Pseudorhodoplanes sp. TaxID=1934341 RepID=UPI003919296D